MELPTPAQQIAERKEAIKANDEKIRQATKDNHWHRKYIKLLEKQIEEEGESASEVLSDISKGLN